jgi:hypothetical protein
MSPVPLVPLPSISTHAQIPPSPTPPLPSGCGGAQSGNDGLSQFADTVSCASGWSALP